jgi:hypothetical protein
MLNNSKPNYETIGKSHDYKVISVHPVNPMHVDFMITTMPRDAFESESYSTVVYEFRESLDTKIIEMPTEEAGLNRRI